MVTMLICSDKKDGQTIERVAKEYVPYYSSENWEFDCCESVAKAQECSKEKANLDVTCLDLTKQGAIEFAEVIRRKFPSMVLQVIADHTISPMNYLKPSIMAASLLLKPYNEPQLRQAVQELFQYALHAKLSEPKEEECFLVESKEDKVRIAYSAILFFEAREKKIFVFAGNKEYGFYSTMDNLEKILPSNFIRCHRGFILNAKRVQEIKLSQNTIVMDDGSRIPFSRSYRNIIKEKLV